MPPAVLDAPAIRSPARPKRHVGLPSDDGPPADARTRFVLRTPGGEVRLPGPPPSFQAIRAWKNSDDRPTTGRYSYLGDRFEIDLTMESLNSHAIVKLEVAAFLRAWVKRGRRGFAATDSFSLSEPSVELSCEPDAMVVLRESLDAGRVTLTEKADRDDEFVEAVGAADLVCEVVSQSSTAKDVRLEPPLLFAAGVREFWRIDCRGDRCEFSIFARGAEDWDPVPADADGFARSAVLELDVRLVRLPPVTPQVADFDLQERD